MAAPTDVRCEAISDENVAIRWTYPGASNVKVYRSVNGTNYAALTPAVAPGTTEFIDTNLTGGTKYWYKLTDDDGATFSAIVTVYAHLCSEGFGGPAVVSLPRVIDDVSPEAFNELAEQLDQRALEDRSTEACIACASDGALVLDCKSGCTAFEVVVDQDINSITLRNCEEWPIDPTFVIPPGDCWKIAGWPPGFGYSGDENSPEVGCVDGGDEGRLYYPLTGGSKGRAVKFKKCKLCGDNTTTSAFLQVVCCSAICTLSCSGNKTVQLKACGGWAGKRGKEYTWTITGDGRFKVKGRLVTTTKGQAVTAVLPANTFDPDEYGSNPPASARNGLQNYTTLGVCDPSCSPSGCIIGGSSVGTQVFDCQGDVMPLQPLPCNSNVFQTIFTGGTACPPGSSPEVINGRFGGGSDQQWGDPPAVEGSMSFTDCDTMSVSAQQVPFAGPVYTNVIDLRSQEMIEAGCNPENLCDDVTPIVVTVTDDIGTAVTIALN